MRKLAIDVSTRSEISSLDVHDAELGDVQCDYSTRTVVVFLKLGSPVLQGINATLRFEGVRYLRVEMDEPWGAGFYVNEVSYADTTNHSLCDRGIIELSILLNSGDKIVVVAEWLFYEEKR